MKRFLHLTMWGFATLLAGFSMFSFHSCTEDIDRLYAPYQAFLRITAVTALHPLFAAANNPGQFCTLTYTYTNKPPLYLCSNPQGNETSYPINADGAYAKPMSIAGFLIGTPSVPDFSGQHPLLAFDLVCPACYEHTSVERSLKFMASERVRCNSCRAEFDLANAGICTEAGSHGFSGTLLRYHVAYAPGQDLLTVHN